MKNRKSSEGRRKLLKTIAAGSGVIVVGKSLPDNWSKPVVDAVMLPAHAQTSPPLTVTFNYFGQNVSRASIDPGRRFAELISDGLIEAAHAGTQGNRPIMEMSAAVDGSTATVLFTPSLDPARWALFQSDLPTDGTAGTVILGPGGDCGLATWPDPIGRGPQAVRIVSYASGDPTITVEITGGIGGAVRQYVLSQGPGTATAVGCQPPV